MDEALCTGYCRRLDAPRLVLAEWDGNTVTADCDWGSCPHEGSCEIAAAIREFADNRNRSL
ncbi:MAG: hypothetical protein LUH51_08670 [Firmicutes bacterium]|nr:hypothetical protein [Bacillota bacterium]